VTDPETGRKRQAYADELIQPQELFLFYAEEERRRQRNSTDGSDHTQQPGGKTTHQIT